MTFTDYLLNGVLIALVVLQLRGRRLNARSFLLPLAVVGYVASQYLHSIPTAGNDLVLALAGAGAGLVLGTGAGLTTTVFRDGDGHAVAKAGVVAAVLWIAGVGARLAFSLYAEHGGNRAIARFSVAHHITSGQAWVACLVLMALVEVVSRSAVVALRYRSLPAAEVRVADGGPAPAPAAIMDFRGRWS